VSELGLLDLVQLREYRATLSAEEVMVSYWRRLTHARIDLLNAHAGTTTQLSFEDLVRVLGDTGTGRTRRGLGRVSAALPLPDLPEIADMWTTGVDRGDPQAVRAAVSRLDDVEERLSGYRAVLHSRIDQATAELIDRYREDPRRALGLIPSD
jgi:hypothetical protein